MPTEQETQTQQGQGQVGYSTAQSEPRPQASFDALFSEQMLPGYDSSGKEFARAYWNLAQATIQTAREVTEMQLFASMQQQIIKSTVSAVLQQLQANPQIIQPVIRNEVDKHLVTQQQRR